MKSAGSRTSASSSSLWRTALLSLRAVDIERRPAVLRHDGEGERQRRVRDVGAADVEGPGDGVRIGDHQRVGAQRSRSRRGCARASALAYSPAKRKSCSDTGAERRRRPVGPDRVDRIGLDRHQRGAGVAAGLARAARRRRRCAATGRSRAWRRPAGWSRASARAASRPMCTIANTAGIDLVARLQRVAAVDEQRGAVGQHDRARRPSR